MFIRRNGGGHDRFLAWRVGLFFLGSGTWVAGLVTERPAVTGAAILILLAAVLLGLFARTRRRE